MEFLGEDGEMAIQNPENKLNLGIQLIQGDMGIIWCVRECLRGCVWM